VPGPWIAVGPPRVHRSWVQLCSTGDLAGRDETGDACADHGDVDLVGERSLAGPGEDGGLCVISRAGGQCAGAAEQGAAGDTRALEHNRHMTHNERVAR
jgi:hypothetical protein